MSMLAEPRRKKKWSLNPRGKLWTNDDSKLGQKLLEKMGWSKGKGLGREEQGDLEPVRLKYKNDAEGVGYVAKDDQWIAHHEEFNAILGKLNGTEAPAPVPDTVPVKSLEVRSKVSKARVHYHKFTRGKDLSRYSESDLASILGKRATNNSNPNSDDEKTTEVEQEVAEEVETKQETSESSSDTEHSHGVTTINKGNIHEYFAAKMAALKAKSQGLAPQPAETAAEPQIQEVPEKRVRINEELNQVKEFCSKKKITEWSQESRNSADLAGGEGQEGKKTKKKKRKEKLEELGEAVVLDSTTEDVKQEQEPPKAKKRKLAQDVVDVSEQNPSAADQATPKKKKKKDKANQENYPPVSTATEATEATEEGEPLNGKKKSKKEKTVESAELTLQTEAAEPSETGEPPKKKKKKSKNEPDASSAVAANQSVPDHLEVAAEAQPKKKKKKSQSGDEATVATPSDEVTLTRGGTAENRRETDGLKKKKKNKNKEVNPTQDTDATTKQSDPLAETTGLPGAVEATQQKCAQETNNADSSNSGARNNYPNPDFSSFIEKPTNVKKAMRHYEMASFEMFKGSNLFTLAGYGNTR